VKFLIIVMSVVVGACGTSSTQSTPASAAPSRRSAEASVALMDECYRGVTPKGSVRSLDRTDVYCSKIYQRPACARAWYELSIATTTPITPPAAFDSKPYVTAVVSRCREEYCSGTTRPALCSSSAELTKANVTAFVTWLLDQELTLPADQTARWARSIYFGPWLE
jgi:hypothetical protein